MTATIMLLLLQHRKIKPRLVYLNQIMLQLSSTETNRQRCNKQQQLSQYKFASLRCGCCCLCQLFMVVLLFPCLSTKSACSYHVTAFVVVDDKAIATPPPTKRIESKIQEQQHYTRKATSQLLLHRIKSNHHGYHDVARMVLRLSSSDNSKNGRNESIKKNMTNKNSKNKIVGGGGGGFGNSNNANARTNVSLRSTFPFAGSVLPGKISPQKVVVDETITKPDYWETGIPKRTKSSSNGGFQLPWMIEVKTSKEIELMKESGLLARHVLDEAGRLVRPGITTDDIDQFVHELIVKNKAYPSPLNYHGFPKSCCTSVNEVICHGIPDDRVLQTGDIINIDITVYKNGYHGDCSEMFVVGPVEDLLPETKTLLQVTYDCWISACSIVKPGVEYKQIGSVVEDYITPYKLSTVKKFCGHGIGSIFHTNPNILHYRNNEPNGIMEAGHTFTIEPMICSGSSSNVVTWPDEWTATTCDGKNSAQFEHTLLITNDGVEALTGKTIDSPIQFWERDSIVHKGIWLGTSANAIQKMNEINTVLLTK